MAAVAEAAARQLALEGGRDQSYRGAKGRSIRYKEFSESGERAIQRQQQQRYALRQERQCLTTPVVWNAL